VDLTSALRRANGPLRPGAEPAAGCLMGSECQHCQTRSWPGRAICQRCGSADLTDVQLPAEGTLLARTVVTVARPGLSVPYSLGQVELSPGLRVFGHIRDVPDDFDHGPVRLVVPADPDVRPIFWFTRP
jgi:uncharacterized OB-fold protein